jgi:hypothetical protein
MPPRKQVVLTPGTARRITKAVTRVERSPYGQPPNGARVTTGWNPGVFRAVVSTAIPTGSFAGPSDTGRAFVYHRDSAGSWVADSAPTKVMNDHVLSASIPTGTTIKVSWIDGDFWLITADCPS